MTAPDALTEAADLCRKRSKEHGSGSVRMREDLDLEEVLRARAAKVKPR